MTGHPPHRQARALRAGQRIEGLDGLRALSVLAVFVHHTGLTALHGGFIGVDVFFVLSGFLITRILQAEHRATGRIAFARFYLRRALRLYPALILFLAAVAAYCAIFQPKIDLAWEIGPALLYGMNWVRAFQVYDAPMTGHTWSLSVEEQFYLLWPLALLAVLRMRRARPALVVGVAVLAAAGWRIYLESHGATSARIDAGFDTRCDGLLVGACIALASPAAVRRLARWWLPAAVFLATCALDRDAAAFAASGSGFLLVAIAAGAVIAKIVTDQGSLLVGVLRVRPLAGLGVVSYGFYLWHYAAIRVLLYSGHDSFGAFFGGLDHPRLAMFAACLAGSLVPTLLSWRLLEAPILARRRGAQQALPLPAAASMLHPR